MADPVRIQLSRTKGFNLQGASRQINGLDAVVVARPTEWGNPYVVGEPVDRKQANRWGWWPLSQPDYVTPTQEAAARRFGTILCLDAAIHQHVRDNLVGKNLACWCAPGEPCHADYLLKIAASTPTSTASEVNPRQPTQQNAACEDEQAKSSYANHLDPPRIKTLASCNHGSEESRGFLQATNGPTGGSDAAR